MRLNHEQSDFRWVTISEAKSLVTFGGQRRLYGEVEREFIRRTPSDWLAIQLGGGDAA